jgi:hypothetical protein
MGEKEILEMLVAFLAGSITGFLGYLVFKKWDI